jgi:hypothetical protein
VTDEARQRLEKAIDSLRVWRRGDQRAPHKPLLLLLMLGRLDTADRLVRFTEVEDELRRLLETFGPPRTTHHPEFPFWHLRSIWELPEAASVPLRRGGSSPPSAPSVGSPAGSRRMCGSGCARTRDSWPRSPVGCSRRTSRHPCTRTSSCRLACTPSRRCGCGPSGNATRASAWSCCERSGTAARCAVRRQAGRGVGRGRGGARAVVGGWWS